MGKLRLNLLVTVLVGLLPVLSYGGAEEIPQPSEGICYKVFYEANFNKLIKLRPHDYSSKISECIASTVISDMKYFKCECKKVEDAKFCQQVVAKKGTFDDVEDYGWNREGENVGKYRIVMVEMGKVKLELFGRIVELKMLPEDTQ